MYKTAVSILQEFTVQKKETLPDYYIENCSESLNPFKCIVKVNGIHAIGYGCTKKEAKQNSAKEALKVLEISSNLAQQPLPVDLSKKQTPLINFVGKLNELASCNGKPYPVYYDQLMPNSNGMFITRCNFLNFMSEGYGLKKKDSKQQAAKNMLDRLRDEDISKITVVVQNVHLEREGKLDSLTEEVLKHYDKLDVSVDNITPPLTTFRSIKNLKRNVFSLQDFEKELIKNGYKYTIETFQKSPCIMMMTIHNTKATIMGKGENKQQALNDLYENVMLMFEHGFSLHLKF